MQWAQKQKGFTIVELLIVIIVIAILAAITIVSYNGIQERSRASLLASDISSAVKYLELAKVDDPSGGYPDPSSTILTGSAGTTFSYLLPSADIYCVDATNNGRTYGRVKGSVTLEGSCAFNIVKNPKGINSGGSYFSSGWFHPLGTTTDTAGVSWNGRVDWHRFVWTGAGNGIKRLYVDAADLVNGQTYTASVLVGNPGSSTIYLTMDFSDQGTTNFSVAAGESKRISVTASRATFDATFRFIDIDGGPTAAPGLLVTDAMLTRTNTLTGYGDGYQAGWVWLGTPGLSKSIGPTKP